jgi:transcriptional regulator with XRE-family HTH domain
MVHAAFTEPHAKWKPRRVITPDVAAMLARARRSRGWSLREAARRAGVAPGTIVHLEAARRAPSAIVAADIIEAYGLAYADAELLRGAAVTDAGRSSPLRARY